MDIKAQIVDKIKRNRISTTEVADCLGKSGAFKDAHAVNRGHFAVGVVKWIYAYEESNWTIHEQARDIPEGSVVLIEAFDCGDRALMGELVSKYMLLYCQAVAVGLTGAASTGSPPSPLTKRSVRPMRPCMTAPSPCAMIPASSSFPRNIIRRNSCKSWITLSGRRISGSSVWIIGNGIPLILFA